MDLKMKINCLCGFIVLVLVFAGGCGKTKRETVSMYDLQQKMLAADASLPDMSTVNGSSEDADTLFAYLSEVSYDKVDDYFLAYSSSGKADEIAVVAVKDQADAQEMKDSLEAHLEGRKKLYKQYDPDQEVRAETAQIFVKDQYIVFIISDYPDEVKTAFENFVSEAK